MTLVSSQSFDGYAAAYDRYCDATHQPLIPALTSLGVVAGGRAIDLGCGSGRHVLDLAPHFDEVVGLDLSEPLLALARRKLVGAHVRFVAGDLTTYTDDRGFDLVFSSTALHHVPELDTALRNIRSLVAPGGWVVLRDTVRADDDRLVWLWRHGGLLLGPLGDFLRHVRSEPRRAWQLLRFGLRPAWLRHLVADRWLTRAEFARRYTAAFPGATITTTHGLTTMCWRRPPP